MKKLHLRVTKSDFRKLLKEFQSREELAYHFEITESALRHRIKSLGLQSSSPGRLRWGMKGHDLVLDGDPIYSKPKTQSQAKRGKKREKLVKPSHRHDPPSVGLLTEKKRADAKCRYWRKQKVALDERARIEKELNCLKMMKRRTQKLKSREVRLSKDLSNVPWVASGSSKVAQLFDYWDGVARRIDQRIKDYVFAKFDDRVDFFDYIITKYKDPSEIDQFEDDE